MSIPLSFSSSFASSLADYHTYYPPSKKPNLDTALELRPALHYPTTVPIPPTPSSPSKRISEPPGVEGYLLRHKPSGPSERVYLSTHDGHLFLCRPSTAQPPEPPLPVYEFINNPAVLVLMPFVLGFASMVAPAKRDKLWERMTGHARRKEERERVDKLKQQHASDQAEGDDGEVDILAKLESDERTRTMTQIVSARGFVDLRDITSVERAQGGNGDVEPTVDEDLGGEEGLAATGDRELLKRCRSFVIRSQNGVEVRFEVSLAGFLLSSQLCGVQELTDPHSHSATLSPPPSNGWGG